MLRKTGRKVEIVMNVIVVMNRNIVNFSLRSERFRITYP